MTRRMRRRNADDEVGSRAVLALVLGIFFREFVEERAVVERLHSGDAQGGHRLATFDGLGDMAVSRVGQFA